MMDIRPLPFVASLVLLLLAVLPVAAEVEEHAESSCLHGRLERAALRDGGWDEATGRDLRSYPPDRVVDIRHMRLQLRFDDIETPRFDAVETLELAAIGAPASTLTLDAVGLDIAEVRLEDEVIPYYHDGEDVTFTFDPPLPPDETRALEIVYTCVDPVEGMYFTPTSAEHPSFTAEVHTQGESDFNSHWFVCRDHPSERMTTEIIANVPAAYSVSSNGRLVSHLVSGDRANWHWLQDKPHVAYLVSLVIGKFDIVEIPHDRVPMRVWVPVGMGDRVERTYGRTGAMLDLFEDRFGVPYPWDRYDQLVVKSFGAGGMENTSATTMFPTAVLDERALLDGDLDDIIAHELAHQWAGDLVTCRDWAHIWLNEGWATYGELMWREVRDGAEAYLDGVRGEFRVARRDRTEDQVAMVSPIYEDPEDVFRRRANPYPKGASILHMLRCMLGDDVFWAGTRLYMARHALDVVETDDFRRAMEEASGRGLEWFFDQWCERPGCPDLDVAVAFDAETNRLTVDVEQTQAMSAAVPAFRFDLPIHVETATGATTHVLPVRERTATLTLDLDGPPTIVAVDPELHVLKTIDVEKPLPMWMAQARRGPTIAARHAAVDALGEHDGAETVALLDGIVGDATARYTLRNAAIDALRGLSSDAARAALLARIENGVEEARVRETLADAARDFDLGEVETRLVALASNDPSYDTRAAAIRSLAALKATDQADLIARLVREPSQHERIRSAALGALADLDDPRGIDLGLEYAAYGWTERARPPAIEAMADLADTDAARDRVVPVLIELLDDPQSRARRAAVRALASIGDERAVRPLEAIAKSHRDEGFKRLAERELERLREKLRGDD